MGKTGKTEIVLQVSTIDKIKHTKKIQTSDSSSDYSSQAREAEKGEEERMKTASIFDTLLNKPIFTLLVIPKEATGKDVPKLFDKIIAKAS